MPYYDNSAAIPGSHWGTVTLSPARSAVMKQTYLLLGLATASALAGGYVGASSPFLVSFFSSWIGWIAAMLVINIVPRVAMAMRNAGPAGVAVLAADGFVSGLVLAPILAMASHFAPDLILAAMAITALIFVAVTLYVFSSSRRFSAPAGLMTGIFVSIVGAVVLNGFLQLGVFGTLISIGIGIFGVVSLVYSTSAVLQSPDADSPIPGALALFAGLFNIFVAALNLLLGARGRD